jgi:TPR repeat protein
MPPEVIQKRIEEAHAAIVPEKTGTMSPEALKRLAEQTHAPVPMPKPELIDLPAPVITTADRITQLTQDHHFGKRWQGIIDHAMKGDAQAQKDIAKAVLNGTNGFDKNPEQAAELYRAAAAAGNTQAKVDLAYMQFHGLGGIQPDTKAALETLREQASGNKYARSMLRHLSGGETVHKSASAALKHAATAEAAPVQAVAAKAVTPTGNVPDGATLKVTWRQTADGAIEGVVNKTDVPGWLKDGMQVSFPTAEVK